MSLEVSEGSMLICWLGNKLFLLCSSMREDREQLRRKFSRL